MKIFKSLFTIITLTVFLSIFFSGAAAGQNNIIIGLDADMSSGSAKSGRAIMRGAQIAMDEINSSGGVLGQQLELVIKDHRGNPARGIDNISDFSQMKNMAAVLGGLHTPVAMAELEILHERKIIYLCPWAAGTPVVRHKYTPNFVFRVSVRDEYAGGFLIGKALDAGFKRPALLLEQTGWGRSNKRSMTHALETKGVESAGLFWFNWGVKDLTRQIQAAKKAGADVIMLVANSPEGVVAVKSMAGLPKEERLPIRSHWGITGGEFFKAVKSSLEKIDFKFLQTYSFINPVFQDRNEKIVRAYMKKYPETASARDIFAPVGTAHAYDLVHLLKLAVEKAGTIESTAVREALEQIKSYKGLVKNYLPPFTPEKHDALNAGDFTLAIYDENGVIVPVGI
ncbi:MAG: ABC transporter substrate-binding protein [Thermodesulfobacteriota bacterium]|nr:ABC transporter substrate-binding protein [Thermodesulfobacteriota bacterium]